MKSSIEIKDQRWLDAGQWIELDLGDKRGKCVGKFSGIWRNPILGLMWELRYARFYSDPGERTSFFFMIKDGQLIEEDTDPLWNAVKVTGPIKSNGWPPKRLAEPVNLRVIKGGKAS